MGFARDPSLDMPLEGDDSSLMGYRLDL
jgi:hypothetical protein